MRIMPKMAAHALRNNMVTKTHNTHNTHNTQHTQHTQYTQRHTTHTTHTIHTKTHKKQTTTTKHQPKPLTWWGSCPRWRPTPCGTRQSPSTTDVQVGSDTTRRHSGEGTLSLLYLSLLWKQSSTWTSSPLVCVCCSISVSLFCTYLSFESNLQLESRVHLSVSVALSLSLFYFFLLSLSLSLSLSSVLISPLKAIFNLNLESTGPECSISALAVYSNRYLILMLIPLAVFLMMAICYCHARSNARGEKFEKKSAVQQSILRSKQNFMVRLMVTFVTLVSVR